LLLADWDMNRGLAFSRLLAGELARCLLFCGVTGRRKNLRGGVGLKQIDTCLAGRRGQMREV